MDESTRLKFTHGSYKDFKEKIDSIPEGTIIFCEDTGKMFIKVENTNEEEKENKEE